MLALVYHALVLALSALAVAAPVLHEETDKYIPNTVGAFTFTINELSEDTVKSELSKKTIEVTSTSTSKLTSTTAPTSTAAVDLKPVRGVKVAPLNTAFYQRDAVPFIHPFNPIMERPLPTVSKQGFSKKTVEPEFWKKTVAALVLSTSSSPSTGGATATATDSKPPHASFWKKDTEADPEFWKKDTESDPEFWKKDTEADPEFWKKDNKADPEFWKKDNKADPEFWKKDNKADPEFWKKNTENDPDFWKKTIVTATSVPNPTAATSAIRKTTTIKPRDTEFW